MLPLCDDQKTEAKSGRVFDALNLFIAKHP